MTNRRAEQSRAPTDLLSHPFTPPSCLEFLVCFDVSVSSKEEKRKTITERIPSHSWILRWDAVSWKHISWKLRFVYQNKEWWREAKEDWRSVRRKERRENISIWKKVLGGACNDVDDDEELKIKRLLDGTGRLTTTLNIKLNVIHKNFRLASFISFTNKNKQIITGFQMTFYCFSQFWKSCFGFFSFHLFFFVFWFTKLQNWENFPQSVRWTLELNTENNTEGRRESLDSWISLFHPFRSCAVRRRGWFSFFTVQKGCFIWRNFVGNLNLKFTYDLIMIHCYLPRTTYLDILLIKVAKVFFGQFKPTQLEINWCESLLVLGPLHHRPTLHNIVQVLHLQIFFTDFHSSQLHFHLLFTIAKNHKIWIAINFPNEKTFNVGFSQI